MNATATDSFRIERANPGDCEALTRIAFAAKRHWGYPEAWIESWREVLTIRPEYVLENWVCVAISQSSALGFYGFSKTDEGHWMLEHLWVEPRWMGRGVGRKLYEHAVASARQFDVSEFRIEADPNAEGFYLRMGARRIGEHHAETCGQRRTLPLLAHSYTNMHPV